MSSTHHTSETPEEPSDESPETADESSETPIIEVRNASVSYDMERGQSRVLDDVSISIHEGEILGVVGESGSGKSMFASSLLNAVPPPGILDGEIIYHRDGEEINLLDLSREELRRLRWEDVAMVFQGAQSSFNPTITIRDHFEETLLAHEYELKSGMAHARQLLSDLYLDPNRVLDSYPHELSGGMQQRALIALSLVLEPDVLVMDEPTAALDLLMQRSILSLLEDVKERYGLTIVFITHDLPLVAGLADRLAVMYAFELVEIGKTENVFAEPTHPYTRALLNAIPNLDTPRSAMEPIEGAAPDPVNVPQGCSYHPRCPLATAECETEDPPFFRAGDEQHSACFHWERAVEEIPLSKSVRGTNPDPVEGAQSDDPIVSVSDVDVHFEQGRGGLLNWFDEPETVHAVDDATLDVYENDVVALVGESGCGKTTLGKAIIGAQRPTSGSISYRGQDIWDAKDGRGDVEIPYGEIRRSLQMIHQDPGSSLNPNRKVKASLEAPLKQWEPGMDPGDREERILGMLEYVGMSPPEDYAHRYPHQLSGGEQQRVALIRALLMNPDVILADEAVSALDVSLRLEMMDLMLELQDVFDTSYVFISHNLSNARYLAGKAGGRIGVMYLGKLVEVGPVDEVIENPQHPYTKVLKWATDDMELTDELEEPPIRGIDVPDPVDPPSGCRFHTRCPDAREACRREEPTLDAQDGARRTACFREYGDDHPYWESEPLAPEATGDEDGEGLDADDSSTGQSADDSSTGQSEND